MNNPAIELIKQLRLETGAGVRDCRKALEQFNGDYARTLNSCVSRLEICQSPTDRRCRGLQRLILTGMGGLG
jgi:hypothetical protein